MKRIATFSLLAGCCVLVGAEAVLAQPMALVSQLRRVRAEASCCDTPGISEEISLTNQALDCVATIPTRQFFQDNFNYYQVSAAQETHFRASRIYGTTDASAIARGQSAPATAQSRSLCDVTFDVRTGGSF